MSGMRMSETRELTILLKAPPTMTPTARSMTLPRLMKVLNSSRKEAAFLLPGSFLRLGLREDFTIIIKLYHKNNTGWRLNEIILA